MDGSFAICCAWIQSQQQSAPDLAHGTRRRKGPPSPRSPPCPATAARRQARGGCWPRCAAHGIRRPSRREHESASRYLCRIAILAWRGSRCHSSALTRCAASSSLPCTHHAAHPPLSTACTCPCMSRVRENEIARMCTRGREHRHCESKGSMEQGRQDAASSSAPGVWPPPHAHAARFRAGLRPRVSSLRIRWPGVARSRRPASPSATAGSAGPPGSPLSVLETAQPALKCVGQEGGEGTSSCSRAIGNQVFWYRDALGQCGALHSRPTAT